MKEQRIIVDEIYKSLQHQVNNLTPEKAVQFYCLLNDKWGTVEHNSEGTPIAIIKDAYK